MSDGALFKDLTAQLRELAVEYPALKEDQLFTAWFMHAYVTDDLGYAVASVTGGKGDKNVDAVLVDEEARAVTIVQTKYRKQLLGKAEKPNDVESFARLASWLYWSDDDAFAEFLKDANEAVAARMRSARRKLRVKGWSLSLIYVTFGKASAAVVQQARRTTRTVSPSAQFEFLAGNRLALIMRDYLDGAAPPVASAELAVDSGDGAIVRNVMSRFDTRQDIDSWVFPVCGADVGQLYTRHGKRIFARNVRGFMGANTPVNRELRDTIASHPANFFYLNNGLTIVCDGAELSEKDGGVIVRVENPQIINGQQTTRSLAASAKQAQRTSVMVRVIRIPRSISDGHERFENLVTEIVQGTNWQNAITQADMVSNDRRQIRLERALRMKGYIYLRKREKKGDMGRIGIGRYAITKEELARAVAGCTLDPVVVRAGVDNLFSEERYAMVFPNAQIGYYLPKYWLLREVTAVSKREPRFGYMKWLVLNFLWSELRAELSPPPMQRQFWEACQDSKSAIHAPLQRAVARVFRAVGVFYLRNRMTTDENGKQKRQDESTFFKSRSDLPTGFAKFWRSTSRTSDRKALRRALEQVSAMLDQRTI